MTPPCNCGRCLRSASSGDENAVACYTETMRFRSRLGVTLMVVLATACHQTPSGPMTPSALNTPRLTVAPASESAVTVDRIAMFPPPGWQVPRMVRTSPDGAWVTYLQSESGGADMALFAFDAKTLTHRVLLRASDLVASERPLSRDEELRRERQRTQIQGITSYAWAAHANVMLVPVAGRVFVRRGEGAPIELPGDGIIDPKLSADGTKVAFARDRELWLAEIDGPTRALTQGAPVGVTRGQSDFNMQEEVHEPSGIWWSPQGDKIAYLEVDERKVAEVPILGFRGAADLQLLRYPRSGGNNPSVRLGIIDLAGTTTWVELPRTAGSDATGDYLGRIAWSADGKGIFLQRLSRDQKHVALLHVDVGTGKGRTLLEHADPAWTAMTEQRPLASGKLLAVWPHEHRQHLALVHPETGAIERRVTSGAWDVFHVVGVDAKGRALIVANKDTPLERALYAVNLEDGSIERMSPESGVHAIDADHPEHGWTDIHSAHDRPPCAAIYDAAGKVVGAIDFPRDPDIERLALRPPTLVRIPASGDAPLLHGALLEPRNRKPGVRYPAIVVVYGGPAVQSVLDDYNPRLLWQHLADRGFVVFQVDNRGSAGYGHAFEAPIRERLGEVELTDQLRALDWLSAQEFVDADRVGIYGHSYGGYMALTGMLRAPGRYKVGVAGSPVTDWSLYDTGYTERYMATPATNEAGYRDTSLAPVAKNLAGKLLVIHALMDENVHFEHTAKLIDAFVAADRTFDLMVFPGERHGYRSAAARRYAYRRVIDYFVENL